MCVRENVEGTGKAWYLLHPAFQNPAAMEKVSIKKQPCCQKLQPHGESLEHEIPCGSREAKESKAPDKRGSDAALKVGPLALGTPADTMKMTELSS